MRPLNATDVLAAMIPSWSMFWPTNDTSARGATTKPVFVTRPASWDGREGSATAPTKTSRPRRLGSFVLCAASPTWLPAARIVWPSGVEIVPALETFGPMRARSRPPTLVAVAGLESWAPGCTVMSPSGPPGVTRRRA